MLPRARAERETVAGPRQPAGGPWLAFLPVPVSLRSSAPSEPSFALMRALPRRVSTATAERGNVNV